MTDFYDRVSGWPMDLEFKPDFEQAIQRVYAWFEGGILDRPPIRFSRHNAEFEMKRHERRWPTVKDRWFDAEYAVDAFERECRARHFHAETFPIFWPNLGPNVFASCYGVETIFGETTTWIGEREPAADGGFAAPSIDWDGEYVRKLDEMTGVALERGKGRFMVGYTDIHPGLDWAVAAVGNEALLYGAHDDPEKVARLARAAERDFFAFYDRYDGMLKRAGQLSATWMNIPSYGKLHIPSCDFSSMISTEHFMALAYEGLAAETAYMDHNIFHVDGKGVARHTDAILSLPRIDAVQWVQGVGEDAPIMQWLPYIRKVRESGKGIVVDLSVAELDDFMNAVPPKGIYLCVATASEEQELDIIDRALRWTEKAAGK